MVLAIVDGRAVALADAMVGSPGEAAEFGLLARPSCGGHAVQALMKLKKHVPTKHWATSLNKPTQATVAVSRCFASVTFDHFALQISGEISKRNGPQATAIPMPLFPSRENLRRRGLPPLRHWDSATTNQLIYAAKHLHEVTARDPNGVPFGEDLLGYASDLLGIAIPPRQVFSRLMIFGQAAMLGLPLDPKLFGAKLPQSQMSLLLGPLMSASVGSMVGGKLDLSRT